MPSRNVFKFVAPRPPKYVEPETEPEIFHAIMVAFLPDPPDSTIPSNPLPVPLVTDPEAERLFFSATNTPSSADPQTRRMALVAHATGHLASGQSFDNDPDWRAIRRAESALRQLIAAHGPDLEVSPDARWVLGVWAVLSQVLSAPGDLLTYLQSDLFRAHETTLWSALYALTVLDDQKAGSRGTIMFWLRLFATLKRAYDPSQTGQFLRFSAIPVSVPRGLVARPAPAPEDAAPDEEEEQAARLSDIAKIDTRIAALEAATVELELIDQALPTKVTQKVYDSAKSPSKPPTQQQAKKPVPSSDQDENEEDNSSVSTIDAAALSAAAITALKEAGIAFEGRTSDAIDDDIEEQLETLEGQREALSKQTELILRGSILVKRVVNKI